MTYKIKCHPTSVCAEVLTGISNVFFIDLMYRLWQMDWPSRSSLAWASSKMAICFAFAGAFGLTAPASFNATYECRGHAFGHQTHPEVQKLSLFQ
jgi:hypothetical protein